MLNDNADFQIVNSAHPHIGEMIQALWGKWEFVPYLESLIHDSRDGARQGFKGEVFFALSNLAEQHAQAYPTFQIKHSIDPWVSSMSDGRKNE